MNKTLKFTQIVDNRFSENENTLLLRDKEIKIALAKLAGVINNIKAVPYLLI